MLHAGLDLSVLNDQDGWNSTPFMHQMGVLAGAMERHETPCMLVFDEVDRLPRRTLALLDFLAICRTSAGALVGGFYAAGKLDFLEDWVRNLTFGRMLSYVNVRRDRSLFGRKLLRQLAEQGRDLAVNDLAMRFAAVAADLATGREVRIETGSLMKAVAASGACPGLFPPVKIGNRWVVDGALANPLPISACRALGAQLVIGVSLFGSRKGGRASATAASSCLNRLSKLVPKRLARAVRLEGLKTRRAVRFQAGAPDMLISPQQVPMVGPNQAATAIEAGREAAERALAARGRLQRCHDENPELWSARRITLRDGFGALRLALWDEERGRLISFAEHGWRVREAALEEPDRTPSVAAIARGV